VTFVLFLKYCLLYIFLLFVSQLIKVYINKIPFSLSITEGIGYLILMACFASATTVVTVAAKKKVKNKIL
jgi:hypothetical protein